MASKRGSLSGQDGVDVAYVLMAFQEINSCVIELRGRVSTLGKSTTLALELIANDARGEIGDLPPLGSVKLTIGYHNPLKMEAAILQALYQLDADMARGAFVGVDKK